MCEIKGVNSAEVDVERKHLEGLLKDRINFYLVFASVFMVGLSRIEEPLRIWSLVAGTFVSLLLGLAVFRTHRLVKKALEELEKYNERHPYVRYRKAIWFPPNANKLLVVIPFLLTVLFATLTVLSIYRPR